MTTAPRSFFSFYEVPLKIRKGKIPQYTISTSEHRLSLEDLKRMYAVGDLRGRVIVSMAKDMAQRVGDFKKIKKEQIRPLLDQEPPVELKILTKKETVIARTHLSQETIELLKVYLPTLSENNDYLFPSVNSCLNEDTINKIIQDLAEEAKISLTGRLSFKCFRKLFLSTCSNLGTSEWNAKVMCGKKVDPSIMSYLDTIDLRTDAKKIQNILSITNHTKRLGNVEETLDLVMKTLRKMIEKELTITRTYELIGAKKGRITDLEFLKLYLNRKEEGG